MSGIVIGALTFPVIRNALFISGTGLNASTATSTLSFPPPAGAVAGDILVAYAHSEYTQYESFTPDTNYNSTGVWHGNSAANLGTWTKTLTGPEQGFGNYVWTDNNPTPHAYWTVLVACYRPAPAGGPVAGGAATGTQKTVANFVLPTSARTSGTAIFLIGTYDSDGTAVPTGATSRFEVAGDPHVKIGDMPWTPALSGQSLSANMPVSPYEYDTQTYLL